MSEGAKRDYFREPSIVPRFPSRFGGLWVDLNNAAEIIEGKLEIGQITEHEAQLLHQFVEDGYVVLRNAVPHEQLDKLQADLDKIAADPPPEAWVNCFDDDGVTGMTRPLDRSDRDKHDRVLKLLDLYSFVPSARDIVFAPATLRFLHTIFDRPALAHQSLYFFKGSQQPLHRDTAFVRLSSAMELAASWTALEDVEDGSGELFYYPGSHKLPEFFFEGKWKWYPPGNREIEHFYDHLKKICEGLPKLTFRANKGDVLIWNADLVHGGDPIRDPSKMRYSLVAHYCPLGVHPMYRYYEGSGPTLRHGPGAFYCSANKVFWRSGK